MKLTTGLVAGAIVGTVAGLLLAPKSGKENRKMVGEKAGKIRSRIKKTPSEIAVKGAHVLN